LPKFTGKIAEWESFRNMFESLVACNVSLSKVQKFYYLKTSVTGEATVLINNLKISEANYDSAWQLLIDEYDVFRREIYRRREILRRADIKAVFQCGTGLSAARLRVSKYYFVRRVADSARRVVASLARHLICRSRSFKSTSDSLTNRCRLVRFLVEKWPPARPYWNAYRSIDSVRLVSLRPHGSRPD
ncbi:hypothetical protein ALC57_16410, partial [Trachymyrmex cornetzi]